MEGAVDILKRLFWAHGDYIGRKDSQFFKSFAERQTPYVTLLTCSDSRVRGEIFGIDPTNAFFCVRNIGNQLLNNAGSVDYGVIHLQTPLLLILGHVRCGAVTAALGDYSRENGDIIRELNGLCISAQRTEGVEDFNLRVERAVLENIHYQVDIALKRYRDRVETGKLTVVGALYDFANIYGKGFGKVFVVNVNGRRSVNEILKGINEGEKPQWEEFLREHFLEL